MRKRYRTKPPTVPQPSQPRRYRLALIVVPLCLLAAAVAGWGSAQVTRSIFGPRGNQAMAGEAVAAGGARRLLDLHELVDLPDAELEKVDIVELNLAVARQLPQCRDLDVRRYQTCPVRLSGI
jgi:hypothetical protein